MREVINQAQHDNLMERLEPGDQFRFAPSEYMKFMELEVSRYFSVVECKRERVLKGFGLFGKEHFYWSVFKHPVVYVRYDGPEHNDWLRYNPSDVHAYKVFEPFGNPGKLRSQHGR